MSTSLKKCSVALGRMEGCLLSSVFVLKAVHSACRSVNGDYLDNYFHSFYQIIVSTVLHHLLDYYLKWHFQYILHIELAPWLRYFFYFFHFDKLVYFKFESDYYSLLSRFAMKMSD